MIERQLTARLKKLGKSFPVLAITGPRQIGKTTLAKQFAQGSGRKTLYLDLESPRDYTALSINPQLFLESHSGKLVIIDEVQRLKSLFPLLRHLVDQTGKPLQFLLLGSATPDVIRDSSETLAGRIAFVELSGINIAEAGVEQMQHLWFRGGFPVPFLMDDDEIRSAWFENFLFTYVQRDLPALGSPAAPQIMLRLVQMLAHLNGQLLNMTSLSKSLGLSVNTIKTYINFLINGYLISKLEPWHSNAGKRLVKTPKIYFRDTGLLHHLHNIRTQSDLFSFPSVGASFETFAVNSIKQAIGTNAETYFYREHAGGEVDLVIVRAQIILATIEIKLSSTATVTSEGQRSTETLKAKKRYVVSADALHAVQDKFSLFCSLPDFLEEQLPKLLKT
jgi:predicted AAA+ superfamily ATPase